MLTEPCRSVSQNPTAGSPDNEVADTCNRILS
jgi:hypothetical protein